MKENTMVKLLNTDWPNPGSTLSVEANTPIDLRESIVAEFIAKHPDHNHRRV